MSRASVFDRPPRDKESRKMSAVSDVVAIGFSGTVEKVRYFVYSEIMRRWPVRLNRVSPRPDTSENKQRKKKKHQKTFKACNVSLPSSPIS